jgi:starch synthase
VSLHVVMVAAEHGGLPGGKVGGVGDVVRDLPRALARQGCRVSVLLPSYGSLMQVPGAERAASLAVRFADERLDLELWRIADRACEACTVYVLHHARFAICGEGRIYCDDGPGAPFATDASKFALFCAAAAELLRSQLLPAADVLHLHDWHAALTLLLLRYDSRYVALRRLHTVFSIHNLALQGIRPQAGHASSLERWYPWLRPPLQSLRDPRYGDCINPMRVGIGLADRVHVVSPRYALEVQRPSEPERGFFGGEGLEIDLQAAAAADRLAGILNGVEYPERRRARRPSTASLLDQCRQAVLDWLAADEQADTAHVLALQRLQQWQSRRGAGGSKSLLVTSVGRLTDQKMLLLRQPNERHGSALGALLAELGAEGRLIMLGSGDMQLERSMRQHMARHGNFLFLRGYSEPLAEPLYQAGDLFLMPSSFEPCGISQMLAMRAAQPCLVHEVGGLADTVTDGVNGFTFSGTDLLSQSAALIRRFRGVLRLVREDPVAWQRIRRAAGASRFTWDTAAQQYLAKLYSASPPA